MEAMYLLFCIVWLLGGIALLAYELAVGTQGRFGPVAIGFCFLWSAYNYARWHSRRAGKEDEKAMRIVEEARKRQNRQRGRSPEYDPNLDFGKWPEPDERPPA